MVIFSFQGPLYLNARRLIIVFACLFILTLKILFIYFIYRRFMIFWRSRETENKKANSNTMSSSSVAVYTKQNMTNRSVDDLSE